LLSTFTVTNLDDHGPGSLRQAVLDADAAPGADLIKFAGGVKGTIPLTSGELSITDDLKIDGPGAGKLTVSGSNASRVFHVSGSATDAEIDGLTIANGRASVPAGPAFGGGLLNDGASVSLSHAVFANNTAQAAGGYAGGGAVANLGGGRFTADHTDFVSNTARGAGDNFGNGGAIYNDQHAIVDIDHATFSENLAAAGNANGGAIAHYGGSQLTLDHSSFAGNQALAVPPGSALAFGGFGGAIQSDQDESGFFGDLGQPVMAIDHSSFTGNQVHVATATSGGDGGLAAGGALELEDNAKATIDRSTFDSNLTVGGDGGAGSAGNDGGAGGTGVGGAIAGSSAILSVSNSQFNDNEAHAGKGGQGGSGGAGGAGGLGQGGAVIVSFNTSTLQPPVTTIDHSDFANNGAFGGAGGAGGSGGNGSAGGFGDGGGLLHRLGNLTVSDSAVSGNLAQGGAGGAPGSGAGTVGGDGGLGRGGGLSNERGGTATVSQITIADNQATGGAGADGASGGNAVGGGVYNGRFTLQAATLKLSDSVVTANQATGGAGGVGGNGGNALGGGIANANTTATGALITTDPFPVLTLLDTSVTENQADGGAAGAGGTVGLGVGGGLYNQVGAVAFADTHTKIKKNHASTSNDDVFGTVTPI
jgi:hypothetical protein